MPDDLYRAMTSLFEGGVALRLLLASLLGAAIGLERERAQKAAGLRTNILICLGAALVMEVSRELAATYGRPVDPSRMAGQVVSGVGFIGAGTILVARGQAVVGLTTAATIWVVAAVGLAVGAEAYGQAVLATLLLIVVLGVLGWMEHVMFEEARAETLEIEVGPEARDLDEIRHVLRGSGVESRLTSIEKREAAVRLLCETRGRERERHAVLESLGTLPAVRRVRLVPAQAAVAQGAGSLPGS